MGAPEDEVLVRKRSISRCNNVRRGKFYYDEETGSKLYKSLRVEEGSRGRVAKPKST